MELAVQNRIKLGKGVKALRKAGLIPAELYGHGLANAHLSVPAKDFAKVFKAAGTSTVVTLLIEKAPKPAIIHNVMHDPISGEVAHIDFYQVRMDEKIRAKVPLEFVGVAPAVKEKGAVLNRSMSEIEVEALPQDLPHGVTVELTLLDDLNKSIYVHDLKLPKGVKVLVEGETAIATATPPAPVEEVAAPVMDVAEVKVESEEKKAERVAEKANAKEEKGETSKPAPGKPAK